MQQPLMREPIEENRRRHLRKVPEKFAFIQIERDEVGKVLNVSEGGLSFSAFAPIPQNGPLYFWFSFNLKDRIEAMAEVVWTDSSRRIGGLRFVHQSQISREHLRMWLAQMPGEQTFAEEVSIRSIPRNGHGGAPGEPDRVARFVAKARTSVVKFPPGQAELPRASNFAPATLRGIDPSIEPPAAPCFGAPKVREIAREEEPARRPSFAPPAARGIESTEPPRARSFAPPSSPGIEPPARTLRASAFEPASSTEIEAAEEPARMPNMAQPVLGAVGKPRRSSLAPSILMGIDSPVEAPKPSSFAASASPGLEPAAAPTRASSFTAATLRGIESAMELVSLQRHLSAKKRQLLLGIFLGICLSAGVAASVLKYRSYSYSPRSSNPGPLAAESSGAKPDLKVQPSSSQGEAKQGSSLAEIGGIQPLTLQNSGKTPAPTTASKQATGAYGQISPFDSGAPPAAPFKPTVHTWGKTPMSSPRTQVKKSMNQHQLWASVQAGNTDAAVQLADLYIKGEGVAQNCKQARVLLLMASEKRNTAAIKKLHELDQNAAACP